jgi:oligoribonuclease
MTGLDPESCTIIEIASLITNNELEIVAEGPNLAIHQTDSVLEAMDEWNTKQHDQSGLTKRVKASTIGLADAEKLTLAFLERHLARGSAVLCGNSIAHDRHFLRAWMPDLASFFHYRLVDVSTIKVLVGRWYDDSLRAPAKKGSHLALDDIRESIAELKYYRKAIFKNPDSVEP